MDCMNSAKTRIQAMPADAKGKRKDDLSMLTVLVRIFKKEGIMGFYRGFGATMLNTFSMRAWFYPNFPKLTYDTITRSPEYAYFFFYSFVRNSYINRLIRKLPPGSKVPVLSTAAELLLGALAGALAQIFTIPVSVIATRQQVGPPSRPKVPKPLADASVPAEEEEDDKDPESFLGVAREIIEEEGVSGLWLGIKPGLVLTVNPAITYGVFERVKSLLLLAKQKAGSSDKLTPGMSFLIGALSKTLATVVCILLRLYLPDDLTSCIGYISIHHGQSTHPSP